MKSKITEWGNSHGIRITSAMMDHLNIQAGEEVDIILTGKGIEIVKNDCSVDYLKSVAQQILDTVMDRTMSVKTVADPYAATGVFYWVVDINPCAPLIREVPLGTQGAYSTLADAKEGARQILQKSIADAQKSLSELRQLGIDNISYIAL